MKLLSNTYRKPWSPFRIPLLKTVYSARPLAEIYWLRNFLFARNHRYLRNSIWWTNILHVTQIWNHSRPFRIHHWKRRTASPGGYRIMASVTVSKKIQFSRQRCVLEVKVILRTNVKTLSPFQNPSLQKCAMTSVRVYRKLPKFQKRSNRKDIRLLLIHFRKVLSLFENLYLRNVFSTL